MTTRTELETLVRNIVAYDILAKPLSSLGQKAGRRRDKLAQDIASELGTEPEPQERFFARTETREEERARTLREGVDAFKELHPRYGNVLEGLIRQKRNESNTYLVYGIKVGFHLSPDDYRRVMRDLDMTAREADAMYPHLLDISDRLGKARENAARDILL